MAWKFPFGGETITGPDEQKLQAKIHTLF